MERNETARSEADYSRIRPRPIAVDETSAASVKAPPTRREVAALSASLLLLLMMETQVPYGGHETSKIIKNE